MAFNINGAIFSDFRIDVDFFKYLYQEVLDHIDYLEEMGATYVHFTPCLKPRPAPNDGGYSVMDYRRINPAFGTMADFEAVTQALAGPGPDVVAVAAGAIEDPVAVTSIRQPGVLRVWLRAEPGTVAERVLLSDHRPLIDDDPSGVLAAQAEARAADYADVADLVLDVEGRRPEELAGAIVDELRRRS